MKNPFSGKYDTFVSGEEPYLIEHLADKLDLYTDEYWEKINAENQAVRRLIRSQSCDSNP